MPSAIDTPTGPSQNGRTNKLMATLLDAVPAGTTVTNSTIYFNGADTVPLQPAMNEPSVEPQPFQNGDATNVTVDGGYQADTIVCEYNAVDYASIDAARAAGLRWKVQRLVGGTATDTGIATMLTVSEGPTLTVNQVSVPTMTVTISYTGTAQNKLDGLGA